MRRQHTWPNGRGNTTHNFSDLDKQMANALAKVNKRSDIAVFGRVKSNKNTAAPTQQHYNPHPAPTYVPSGTKSSKRNPLMIIPILVFSAVIGIIIAVIISKYNSNNTPNQSPNNQSPNNQSPNNQSPNNPTTEKFIIYDDENKRIKESYYV